MQSCRVALVASLCAVAAGALTPIGADDRAARRELGTIYAQYQQSIQARDSTAFARWIQKYLTPDAINQSPNGERQTRQQLLDTIRTGPWNPPRGSVTGKIEKLTLRGNQATVLYATRVVQRPSDPAVTHDPTGRTHTLVVALQERDTWIKTPAGWKSSLSENFPPKPTLDGKPGPLPRVHRPGGDSGGSRKPQ